MKNRLLLKRVIGFLAALFAVSAIAKAQIPPFPDFPDDEDTISVPGDTTTQVTTGIPSPGDDDGSGDGSGGGSIVSSSGGRSIFPGPRLSIPVITNNFLSFNLLECDTNTDYTVFCSFDLNPVILWQPAAFCPAGQLSCLISNTSSSNAFFRLGWTNPFVATPVFNIQSGIYSFIQKVTVTCETPGASIHYTIDGADPLLSDPEILSGSTLLIGGMTTLKAKAFKQGGTSAVRSAEYRVVGDIAAGSCHSLWLRPDGVVYTWGGNWYGQLGDGSDGCQPKPVSGVSNVVQIAAGDWQTYALESNGALMSWGDNHYGQLGIGTNRPWNTSTPMRVLLTNVTQVAAGYFHTLATSNGIIYAWGDGVGRTPTLLPGLASVNSIAGGGGYSMAVSNGCVFAWGSGDSGQLGNGANNSSATPLRIAAPTNVVQVQCAYSTSYALTSDGQVWSWGDNSFGQLGIGTADSTNRPVRVTGLTNVAFISAPSEGNYCMALKTDGTVWAWGANWDSYNWGESGGQLGNGTYDSTNCPCQVFGLTNIVLIAAGGLHAMALQDNGTLWSWGNNGEGELGNTDYPSTNRPVQITFNIPDSDGDGLPDYIDSFPNDFYNGTSPRMTIIGGDNQTGTHPNIYLPNPLTIRVTDNHGQIVSNAPVTFSCVQGDVYVSPSNNDNDVPSPSVLLQTDANGQVSIFAFIRVTSPPTNRIMATTLAGTNIVAINFTVQVQFENGVSQLPNTQLGYWKFDTQSLTNEAGQTPIATSNLTLVAGCSSNAVQLSSTTSCLLRYPQIELNNHRNIALHQGSIAFWFSPNWASVAQGGSGPGNSGNFISVGSDTNHTWNLSVDSKGSNIVFWAVNDTNTFNYLTAPISWISNQFHQVVLTFTTTNSALYIDGNLSTKGDGVCYWPESDSFNIGSDEFNNQVHGRIDELQTFNYPLDVGTIAQSYAAIGLVDGDADGLPDIYESFVTKSDPNNPDTGNTGTPDGYKNSSGDGFSNLAKYQNGTDPNQFVTPAAPQNVVVIFNTDKSGVDISWVPSPGNVTQYIISEDTGSGSGFVQIASPNANQLTPDATGRLTYHYTLATSGQAASFSITAVYGTHGNSNPSAGASDMNGRLGPVDFHMVHGLTNSLVMVLDRVLTNITTYTLTCTNADPYNPAYNQTVVKAINVSPEQALERYYPMPDPQLPPGFYTFQLVAHDANGNVSTPTANYYRSHANFRGCNYLDYVGIPLSTTIEGDRYYFHLNLPFPVNGYTNNNSLKEPVLIQELRAASDAWWGTSLLIGSYWDDFTLTPLIYDAFPINTNQWWGTMTYLFDFDYEKDYVPIGLATNFTAFYSTPNAPISPSDYYYTTSHGSLGRSFNYWGQYTIFPDPIVTWSGFSMADDTKDGSYRYNEAGLKYLSMKVSIGGGSPILMYPGDKIDPRPDLSKTLEVALETETPTLQTINYYFDGRDYPVLLSGYQHWASFPPLPDFGTSSNPPEEGWRFSNWSISWYAVSLTNTFIVGQVGKPVHLQGWSEVNAVRPNGIQITNKSYFINQDFDQAFLCDPATGDVPRTTEPNVGGKMKIDVAHATATGVLSPNLNYVKGYGGAYFWPEYWYPRRSADFTPTQRGKYIITTKPDSHGNYGEVVVYAIDMQVDANHDGIMDNRDLTSIDTPMEFWVNNDYDRFHYVDDTAGFGWDSEQDDINDFPPSVPMTQWDRNPDSNFHAPIGSGSQWVPAIPCERDLEDYTRLWIPGLSNLMQVLPTNYTITLSWRNNSGAAIRLFRAAEANGGTNYLFDTNTAAAQINYNVNPCYGILASNQTISISDAFRSTTVPHPSDYFILCGVSRGTDELVMQVKNQFGGLAGETSLYWDLKDIKEMYERLTVGEDPKKAPDSVAYLAQEGKPAGVPAFKYPPAIDSQTSYILYVHGWNMETWEKDRFAETAFKRLYWQGYQGRFGVFRWPTDNGFDGLWDAMTDRRNYDNSEFNAWRSATGLKDLLADLKASYGNNVYLVAHSMGNVVAGEALRLAGTNRLVNTYVASQAAVPAHTYDNSIADYDFNYLGTSFGPRTPNIYKDWFASNGGGTGRRINFFNGNDYALQRPRWEVNQLLKPDQGSLSATYFFSGYPNNTLDARYTPGSADDMLPWKQFCKYSYLSTVTFDLTNLISDRYEVMAFAAQARSTALGRTPNVQNLDRNIDLTRSSPTRIWPVDSQDQPPNQYSRHKWHSAQFRSMNMLEKGYWQTLLSAEGFNLK